MGAVGTYTLIQKITVGSAGAASIDFTAIPATYTDLCLKASIRTNRAADEDGLNMSINGTSTTYASRTLIGNSASAAASSSTTPYGQLWVSRVDAANATANTFGNFEIYIPNYANTSYYKSYSIDGVTENNSSTAFSNLVADLWSSTAAINQLTLSSGNSATIVQYSSASLYGITTSSVPASPTPQAQGGDIIVNDGTYWYHAFISTGAFVPKRALTADVLVVAGGGGGGTRGNRGGGGGGSGGLVYTASQSFANGTSYTTTIGAGGASTVSGTNSNLTGGILSLTAGVGGGRGSSGGDPGNGGSGGGGDGAVVGGYIAGGTGTSGQGFAGGRGYNDGTYVNFGAGGGGGSSAAGSDANASGGGNGGAGVNTYSSWLSVTGLGVSNYIAGGGGGGSGKYDGTSNSSVGSGGSGGGGAGSGSNSSGVPGTAGTVNTGSGGGGANTGAGGAGGSGVIIIRYKI